MLDKKYIEKKTTNYKLFFKIESSSCTYQPVMGLDLFLKLA